MKSSKYHCMENIEPCPKSYHFFIILIPTPDLFPFYFMLGAILGMFLYGDVPIMKCK